jgi:hypothetical protein
VEFVEAPAASEEESIPPRLSRTESRTMPNKLTQRTRSAKETDRTRKADEAYLAALEEFTRAEAILNAIGDGASREERARAQADLGKAEAALKVAEVERQVCRSPATRRAVCSATAMGLLLCSAPVGFRGRGRVARLGWRSPRNG